MRSEAVIRAEILETQTRLAELQRELSFVQHEKSRSNSQSYEKRKQILEEAAPLFVEILKTGDFVKVTGAKSAPIRKIKEISKTTLVASAVYMKPKNTKNMFVDEYDIRTCGTNKITSALINGKWVTAKELIESQKK